ncbi:hypothetical protein SteCoe_5682 [Stentor coeruleus]|uniref:Uncharacterized protein n=1 Tax=Stentor coeruleus TaxID=5963 RepID=A0A1R2CRM0_9CILI|nr:hypothetical protein SteCoe_5682 [Stentor coeruleus]
MKALTKVNPNFSHTSSKNPTIKQKSSFSSLQRSSSTTTTPKPTLDSSICQTPAQPQEFVSSKNRLKTPTSISKLESKALNSSINLNKTLPLNFNNQILMKKDNSTPNNLNLSELLELELKSKKTFINTNISTRYKVKKELENLEKIYQLENKLSILRKDNSNLKVQNNTFSKEIDRKKKENEDLVKALNEVKGVNEILVGELKEKNMRIEDLEQNKWDLNEKSLMLMKEVNEKNRRIEEIEQEKRDTVNGIKVYFGGLHDRIVKMKDKKRVMKRHIEGKKLSETFGK